MGSAGGSVTDKKATRKRIAKRVPVEPPLLDKKAARKRITEQVLIERLSLDEDWLDPDSLHVQFHKQLPESLQSGKSSAMIRTIEQDIDRLVALGCHRGVVYWCLDRLSGHEEEFRLRGATTPVLDEHDSPGASLIRPRPLATREDMFPLISQLRTVSRSLWRYGNELLLAAQAFDGQIPLPNGLITDGPADSTDALYFLKSALTWAGKLAEHWAAPQLSTVMKSKGTLFLAAYVSIYARATASRRRESQRRRTRGNAVSLRRPDAKVVVRLVDGCSGIAIHEDDLVAKLKSFQADHPMLYNRLISLLDHLHLKAKA